MASSAYSSRRADEVEEPREDEAVLEDEALGVLLTVGVARLADELNEPHPAATDTQRSTDTALTGAQLRRKLTAMPRRPHQSWTTDDRPVMLHAVLGWLRRKRPAQARAPSGPSNPRNSPIELASLSIRVRLRQRSEPSSQAQSQGPAGRLRLSQDNTPHARTPQRGRTERAAVSLLLPADERPKQKSLARCPRGD